MTDYSRFQLSTEQGIAHLQLSCPEEYNKLSQAFWQEFPEVIRAIDRDASARVLVISAQGKHFCAGLDTAAFETLDNDLEPGRYSAWFREHIMAIQEAFTALERIRIPVIAAVQGACVGGGVGMASACDMRYCSADAFFSIEETNIGITCDVGSLQRLPHIMSETHMREWVYTGKRLAAAKAQAWQLVGEVYPDHASLLSGVMDVAREIAQKSPLVLHGSKLSMNYTRDHSVADSLEQVATFNAGVLRTEEVMRAMKVRKAETKADFADLQPRIEITKGV